MDIRPITPDYAVSPQITSQDIPDIVAAGYKMIICNRPDGEIPPDVHADAIKAAATAAGLEFVLNPVIGGAMTMENVAAQASAIAAATGPALAYCASGNRSSIVWSLANAGKLSTDEILAATDKAGYNLHGLRPQLDAMANNG